MWFRRQAGGEAGGTVKANLVSLGIAEAAARLAQFAALALLGRMIGPEGVGVVGVAWSMYQMAVPFVQVAPEMIGTREVARGDRADHALVEVSAVKLVIAAAAGTLMVITAAIAFRGDDATRVQVAAEGVVLLSLAVNGMWLFRGLRRFSLFAAVRVAQSGGLLAGLGVGLWIWPASWMVPVVETLTGLVAAVLAWGGLSGWRSLAGAAAAIGRRLHAGVGTQLREALQLGLGSFLAAVTWSAPLLAARPFLDAAGEGQLAVTLRLMLALVGLYQLALQVFHPVLAERYSGDRERGRGLAAALTVHACATTLPVAIGLVLVAPWIVVPLLGSGFAAAGPVLSALAPVLVPITVGSVFGYALLADGRYRTYVALSAAGAIASLVASALAFRIWPQPQSVGVLTPVMALIALASAVAAWRHGLVSPGEIRWHQLSPGRVRALLGER